MFQIFFKLRVVKQLKMQTKKIVDYPLYNDPDFYRKIFHRKEFFECRYKPEWWKQWVDVSKPFKHLPHQQLLFRFISPYTPYMGVFVFHGCGSGKSEVACQIVESNKLFMDEHSTNALILVPNDMIMSSMLYEFLGKYTMPDGSIRFQKRGTGNKYIDSTLRDKLNNINNHVHTADCPSKCSQQLQRKIRKILTYIKKEKMLQYYEIETHQRFAKNVGNMTPEHIFEVFSNRILIVDEIHKIRNLTLLYNSLCKIVDNAYNVKLVFMSGTACIDREYEILPIINLLKRNDGQTSLMTEQNIQMLFCKDSVKQKKAVVDFSQEIKGYVSFIRGMNPITFPLKREMGERMFKHINFNTITCAMKGKQLATYLLAFFNEFNPNIEADMANELWEKSRCASRCASDNINDDDWLYENVGNISCKFEKMWENFKLSEGKGAILIYAFNVEKGINLVEKFLRKNGILPFTLDNATEHSPKYINFSNITNNDLRKRALDVCKSHENYKGDYIKFILGTGKIRTGITFRHLSQGHVIEPDWNIPTTEQTLFRGARQFSHFHPLVGDTNKTILTFRYRSVILDEHIAALPDPIRNKYEHFIDRFSDQLTRRGFLCPVAYIPESGGGTEGLRKRPKLRDRLISIDDFMYRTCLKKDLSGNKVERLLKEYAFDNPLQIKGNYFPDIEQQEFEGSRISNYDSLEYLSPIPNEYSPTLISKVVEPTPDQLDFSTYDFLDLVLLVNDTENTIQYVPDDVFDAVVSLFVKRLSWKFHEIVSSFKQLFKNTLTSGRMISFVVNWLVESQYTFPLDVYGDGVNHDGYIIYDRGIYSWVTLASIGYSSSLGMLNVLCDTDTPNNFESCYVSIQPLLSCVDAIKDVFDFVDIDIDVNYLFLPTTVNSCLYSVNRSLVLTLSDPSVLCGVIDNTKDKPNDFNLKLWHGKTKIAASSKKLVELYTLCSSLGIDSQHIKRKDKVCELLRDRLIQLNRMLVWAPGKRPSLYRLYMVCKFWHDQDTLHLFSRLSDSILQSDDLFFVDVLLNVVYKKQHVTEEEYVAVRQSLHEYFNANSANIEFVLIILERMCGPRPTRLNINEWLIVNQVYEKFYQQHKSIISDIYNTIYCNIQQRIVTLK